jgi:hypothetical protein
MAGFRKHQQKKHQNLPVEYSHAVGSEDVLMEYDLKSGSVSSEYSEEEEVVGSGSCYIPEEAAAHFTSLLYQSMLDNMELYSPNQRLADNEGMDVDDPPEMPDLEQLTDSMTLAHTETSSGYSCTFHPRINGEYISICDYCI